MLFFNMIDYSKTIARYNKFKYMKWGNILAMNSSQYSVEYK